MPCFPTFAFPFQSSRSDLLHLMAPIINYISIFDNVYSPKPCQRFLKAALFAFYSQNPEIALL